MTQQLELQFKPARGKRNGSSDDADALIDHLRVCGAMGGKLTAADHATALDWSDRRIRAAAEASGGRVLSAPGCIGYRLAEMTSVDEYYHVERARFISQIKRMQARVVEMDRAVHAARGGCA